MGFILGTGLASFYSLDHQMLYLLVGLGLVFLIPQRSRMIGLVLILASLAVFRWQLVADPDLSSEYDKEVSFTATIDREVDLRLNQQRLTVLAKEYNTHFLITTYLYPRFSYGDQLEISGRLQEPEAFSDFDYQGYLERYGIHGIIYRPWIEKTGEDSSFRRYLFQFKGLVKNKLDQYLVEPTSSLVKAIILATKGTVPSEIKENFSKAGTSHIIAISGMHITIISGLILNLLLGAGLNRKQAFWAATLILLIYLFIIGFPASAVRATFMGFLVMWAMYLGRLNNSLNAILLTASVMLLLNPRLLRNDIGFQLSFAAVIGIIYFKPWFDKLFEKLSSRFQIKEAIAMTLAAQVTTFPLIIYYFDRFSLVAPLANILVVPVLPFILILGIVGIGLSFIIPFLAPVVFGTLSLLVTYVIKVIELLSGFSFSYMMVDNFTGTHILVSYFVVSTGLLLINKYRRRQITIASPDEGRDNPDN
ncbi:MAG: ComEC/Rec2 family competence protein [Patescibacteria group bacterium]